LRTINLETLLANTAKKNLPPVEQWHPTNLGNIDIVIDEEVRWFHEGGEFQRQSLVKLLSSILRYDNDIYYLVTPAEQLSIIVKDVPFLIVAMQRNTINNTVNLITNTEEVISLTEADQWQLRSYNNITVPYCKVRSNLWARCNRNVFYQLIEDSYEKEGTIVFQSNGLEFHLGSLE